MDEARTTAVVISSTGGEPSKHRCLIGPAGTWASLPLDLLLEIFRRLESTAIICCAAACRPWRRAIIGNASFLRPRPDRFLPSLLLGVFHGYGYHGPVWLRRTVGPLQSAFPLTVPAGYIEAVHTFISAAAAATEAGKWGEGFRCGELLSSRDGFILVRGRDWRSGFCLCNPMTGDCAFVPDATIKNGTYILVTAYDLLPKSGSASDDDLAVRILAVHGWDKIFAKENRIKYQLFSFKSGGGVWGPVRRSVELQQVFWVLAGGRSTAVCRDIVHWLGGPTTDDSGGLFEWTVALDVHTGRTWVTELPPETDSSTLLGTTGDGRLSLIRSLTGHQIQVWVLNGGDRWSIQQTVDVREHLPHCPEADYFTRTAINAFCPRSGCVLAVFADQQEIRINLESGPCPVVECISDFKGCHCKPYEMDWSTYISKMKCF